jgi:hypothetical protein
MNLLIARSTTTPLGDSTIEMTLSDQFGLVAVLSTNDLFA